MEIYGLKNCDKCRMARRALNLFNIIDIKNEPISEELLQAAFLTFGEQLINRSSTTWRGLSDIEKGSAPLAFKKISRIYEKAPDQNCWGAAIYRLD